MFEEIKKKNTKTFRNKITKTQKNLFHVLNMLKKEFAK